MKVGGIDVSEVPISIHALLAESDRTMDGQPHRISISIHALLAESDSSTGSSANLSSDFYPRSPCGERLVVNKLSPGSNIFLSTLSLRRATINGGLGAPHEHISIHALLAESDHIKYDIYCIGLNKFLSTLSLRRATTAAIWGLVAPIISIHALLAESDARLLILMLMRSIFLSTLSLRRATARVNSFP